MIFIYCLIAAICLTAALRLPGLRTGLDTADEGYLLYGIQECLKGRVPIRDFRAYDPGRYYFCAFFMRFIGATYFTQRLIMSVVIALALALAGNLIYQASGNIYIAATSMFITYIWLKPYYKAFEIMFSLLAVTIVSQLIIEPTDWMLFSSGVTVGLSFFFGMNIGLYMGLAVIVVYLLLVITHAIPVLSSLGPLTYGTVLGLLPVIVMLWCVPGYLTSYWNEKVVTVFRRGSTNLPLQLPWVSRDPPQFRNFSKGKRRTFTIIFSLLPLVYLSQLLVCFIVFDNNPHAFGIFFSTGLVGIIYLHHLFSRSDLSHICQTIHPALISLVFSISLLPQSWMQILLLSAIFILSFWAIVPELDEYFKFRHEPLDFDIFQHGNESFIIKKPLAQQLRVFQQLLRTHSEEDQTAFFAPTFPGLYSLFARSPACYDVFCVYPTSTEKQERMLNEIHQCDPAFIIIADFPLDQQEELRFRNTHTILWREINKKFTKLKEPRLAERFHVFVKQDKQIKEDKQDIYGHPN